MNLIEVYKNTKDMINSGQIQSNSVSHKHNSDSIKNVKFDANKSNVIVEPLDTVTSLIKWSKVGKTAILNMASARRPGGGVENGARAQEECLFRCSDLSKIPLEFYPLQVNECVYTNNAIFFKDFDYNVIDPSVVDVVTIPALNLNPFAKYDNLESIGNYEDITLMKMDMLFKLPFINGCENILLGAWGCGVFSNDPTIMSNLFKKYIENNNGMFKNIIFPIINDHNSSGNNYQIFKNVLN